ncbi:MAG: hypothetical protein ACHQET_06750 [Chitinophagales bacterium]
MNKAVLILMLSIFIFLDKSFAQSIDYSLDSVNSLLCKKWEANYAMVGGTKIYREPNAVVIVYEFSKDKTFVVSSNKPGEEAKGTWIYNPKQKLIKLVAKGKNDSKIISLKAGELVMLEDTKNATPNDGSEMKMYYKIKVN